MAVEATPAQLPLVAARLLLAAFYFYFMLGLTFNAALRTNGALMRRTRSPRSAARFRSTPPKRTAAMAGPSTGSRMTRR